MNKYIGIVGGGQLGRMLAMAAKKLGFGVAVLDPTHKSPASEFADTVIVKSFKDPEGIRELAKISDFITFEIESANAKVLEELVLEGHNINPAPRILSIIKDKFNQKKFLEGHNILVAPSVQVKNRNEIIIAVQEFGYPILLKSRFDAYDGRGNALIRDESEIDFALERLAISHGDLYVEKFIPFVKELAVVVARGNLSEIVVYPPVETIHKNNICHLVIAQAPVDSGVIKKAEKLAIDIISILNGVGVFAIEMFLTFSGELIVNEIAPRVHNSGHQTIEANETSQFEQQIRAIAGLPLGPVSPKTPYAVMINILGERQGVANISGVE
ncbi:5-(carboxyamino)imidazole ribonucleotide synthase, partial [Candidatus Azambacteria bacterium]|nr:5-(carboxyamino)imidazole ribonucleotide synthase [Candidatus Azambacteria bacterium]